MNNLNIIQKIKSLKTIEGNKLINLAFRVQIFLIIGSVILIFLLVFQISPLLKQKASLVNEINEKTRQLDDIKMQIELLTPIAKKGLGFKNTESSIPKQSIDAYSELREYKKYLKSEIKRREQITIQYFSRNLDQEVNTNIVIPSLKEFGFKLKQEKPMISSPKINAIWFGKNITKDDIRIVAFTLMSAGIQIKLIQPFVYSDSKASLIQIGALESAESNSVLTVKQIKEMNSIKAIR